MRGETQLVLAPMFLADQMRRRGPESVALAVMVAPVKNARDSNRQLLPPWVMGATDRYTSADVPALRWAQPPRGMIEWRSTANFGKPERRYDDVQTHDRHLTSDFASRCPTISCNASVSASALARSSGCELGVGGRVTQANGISGVVHQTVKPGDIRATLAQQVFVTKQSTQYVVRKASESAIGFNAHASLHDMAVSITGFLSPSPRQDEQWHFLSAASEEPGHDGGRKIGGTVRARNHAGKEPERSVRDQMSERRLRQSLTRVSNRNLRIDKAWSNPDAMVNVSSVCSL